MSRRKAPAGGKTVRIRFCGGCNPEYDRLAVAGHIKERLFSAGYRLASGDAPADIVVAVCGCACACADVSGIDRGKVIFITNPAMADKIDVLISSLSGLSADGG